MDDQILIIFGTNIPDTNGHQMTIYVSVPRNVCFCTTWGKQNKQNVNIYSMQCHYLINIMQIWHILSNFLGFWLCNCRQ